MNNKISEEWFNKQKDKYSEFLAEEELDKKYLENKDKIYDKLKSELTLKYNCHSYSELSYIFNGILRRNNSKYRIKDIDFGDLAFRQKFKFMNSINLVKMRGEILRGSHRTRYLVNEDSIKTFLELFILSDTIYHDLLCPEIYFGMELACYKGEQFTEDERQYLNLYNSFYDTYLEYYQKFIDTLPESKFKQEFEAIPNELIKTENEKIDELIRVENEEVIERIFDKKFYDLSKSLKRKKNK